MEPVKVIHFKRNSHCKQIFKNKNVTVYFSRGPRPLNRRDFFIRFTWFSIYAWGLPLVLQMAVVIYRDSLGPPVRLCWFGNPISKFHVIFIPARFK